MMNYTWYFSQSETEKYFERIITKIIGTQQWINNNNNNNNSDDNLSRARFSTIAGANDTCTVDITYHLIHVAKE